MGREAWRAVGGELAARWMSHGTELLEAGYAGPDDYRRRGAGAHGAQVSRWIREGWARHA